MKILYCSQLIRRYLIVWLLLCNCGLSSLICRANRRPQSFHNSKDKFVRLYSDCYTVASRANNNILEDGYYLKFNGSITVPGVGIQLSRDKSGFILTSKPPLGFYGYITSQPPSQPPWSLLKGSTFMRVRNTSNLVYSLGEASTFKLYVIVVSIYKPNISQMSPIPYQFQTFVLLVCPQASGVPMTKVHIDRLYVTGECCVGGILYTPNVNGVFGVIDICLSRTDDSLDPVGTYVRFGPYIGLPLLALH